MPPSFAAEKTLGKLTKWLRILGFDTVYELECPNRSLVDLADTERIILTRTQRIRDENTSCRLIFIKSNRPFDQLQQIIHALELEQTDMRPFSRCLNCNILITPVDKASVRNSVPDYIWETQDSFQICNRCQKIYWPGSHLKRSQELINKLFDV
jgi:uncharacterized protein with PIN domain